MTWEPELEELAQKRALAKRMGGAEGIERQHAQGRLTVRERLDVLLDPESFQEVGTMLGVFESDTGTPLVPLPFELESQSAREFRSAGDRWLIARRELVEPGLVLIAAAPLSPFTAPYLAAARRGGVGALHARRGPGRGNLVRARG